MLITKYLCSACRNAFRSRTGFKLTTSPWLQFCRMASILPNLAIFRAISRHDPASTAIIHSDSNQAFSYNTLLQDVVAAKKRISQTVRNAPLNGERIAFLAENGYDYVGTWHIGPRYAIVTISSYVPRHPRAPSCCAASLAFISNERASIHHREQQGKTPSVDFETRDRSERSASGRTAT
jgi:hypothetical protein